MLQAAALRGVKVNIIVYKEVPQALTRKYHAAYTQPNGWSMDSLMVPVISILGTYQT